MGIAPLRLGLLLAVACGDEAASTEGDPGNSTPAAGGTHQSPTAPAGSEPVGVADSSSAAPSADAPDTGSNSGSNSLDAGSNSRDAGYDVAGGSADGDASLDDVGSSRRCDESAAAGLNSATWEIVTSGLDDFVVNWAPPEAIEDPDAPGVAGVAFNDGTWVMVGQGSLLTTGVRVATSHDGVSWQTHLVPFDGGRVGSVSRVFVFGDQFAFGVTPQPSSEAIRPALFTSADGQDWTAHPLPAEVQVVFDLASDGERVAVAAGNLWTSTDLEDWTQVRFRSERDLDGVGQVEFASGLWMVSSQYTLQASGESFANARISTNGVDWELIDLSGSENFYIAQLDPTWLITTWPGDHFRSSDGENFEPVEPAGAWIRSPLPPSPRIRAAGRRFLNVIEEPVAGQPTTLRVIGSDEGATWVDFGGVPGLPVPEDAVEIAYEIADIAYGHCRYIAAGAYRVIIRGALDPPAWWRETGPLLLTADLAQ